MHHKISSHKPPRHEVAPLSESPHMNPKTVYILYSTLNGEYRVRMVAVNFSRVSLEKTKQESMLGDSLEKWGITEAPLII